MIIAGLVLIFLCSIAGALYVIKHTQTEEDEHLVNAAYNKQTNHSIQRGQLNVLMSSARIEGEVDANGVKIKKKIVEQDCLTDLLELDERISKNMEILNDLSKLANDYSLPLASGKIAKHQLFGTKFLGIVRKRAEKVRQLKKETDMSEKKIRDFVVRAFTVEMNVMNDLIDRESYVTAVSWKDLDQMVEKFEKEISEVKKIIKPETINL